MPHDPDTEPTISPRSFRDDLPRATLVVLFICGLLAAVFWVLRPFIGPAIWATLIVVAGWPLMLRLQKWLGGRRWAAVTIMLLALLMLFMLPVIVGGQGDPTASRTVVTCASYEARRFGVHAGMPLRAAARRCRLGRYPAQHDGNQYEYDFDGSLRVRRRYCGHAKLRV